ncbi:sensor histidine kinase [Sphingobacterium mizutaii]|uniref:ATP-binding protein n=1 Tax=Sphingobacterium mizutaii TaxID=1010 RepID=UPI00162A955F|nr:sensor histidine kinase [Sphingobacterium mizutaii]
MTQKLGLLLFYWLFFFTQGASQSKEELNQHSDTLFRKLQQIKNHEEKALALFDLSFFWSDYDTIKAFSLIRDAEKVLGKTGNSMYYRGIKNFYRAAVYFESDPDKAKQNYLEAEKFLIMVKAEKRTEASRYRARLWGSYGALLQREGKAHEYVEILLERAIPLAKDIRDSSLIGNNFQNVAMNLMNMGDYEKADEYYEKAMQFLKGKKEGLEVRFTLFINISRNALLYKNYNKSGEFLDSATLLAAQLPHSSYIPIYHSVSGSHWAATKNYEKAHAHFESGLAAAKILNNDDLVATLLFDQFETYKTSNQYRSAKKKLLEILPYVRQRSSLRNKQMIYYNLATTATELRQYQEAVQWYDSYKKVSDTLFTDKNQEYIHELEKKFQTAEKEKAFLKIRTENQKKQLSLQNTRMLAGLLLLTSIILGVASYIWYNALKSKKKLSAQKELLLEKELKNHRQQEKLNLFHAMLQGQERERSRIARDLHDGLGGMLASVKLKLSSVVATADIQENIKDSSMELYTIINQLDHSVNELRRVARNMMPESLLYMGLKAALKDLCNSICSAELKVDFQLSNLKDNYPQPFQIAVYRIVQELLTNAVKHSGASQVWVQCSHDEGKFFISVEDNGQGFDAKNDLFEKDGIGISNIRNRVEILNGQLEIDTAAGRGASFHIQLDIYG